MYPNDNWTKIYPGSQRWRAQGWICHTDDQEWWRQYTCSVCHQLYARAFHLGVAQGKRQRYRSKKNRQKNQQRAAEYSWTNTK